GRSPGTGVLALGVDQGPDADLLLERDLQPLGRVALAGVVTGGQRLDGRADEDAVLLVADRRLENLPRLPARAAEAVHADDDEARRGVDVLRGEQLPDRGIARFAVLALGALPHEPTAAQEQGSGHQCGAGNQAAEGRAHAVLTLGEGGEFPGQGADRRTRSRAVTPPCR